MAAERIPAVIAGHRSLHGHLSDHYLHGLSAVVIQALRAGWSCVERGDLRAARRALSAVAASVPGHPEVLRLRAALHASRGQPQCAIEPLRRALSLRPDHVLVHADLGDTLRACGDIDGAYAVWRNACASVPDSALAWFNLGCNLDLDGRLEEARAALDRALQLEPAFADARIALAGVLVDVGEIERAEAEYRHALRLVPESIAAWFGLANIKNVRFAAVDMAQMEHLEKYTKADEQLRAALEFALAKAYEDHARHADAFATLRAANARMRALRAPWNAAAFAAHVDEVLAAFAQPVADAGSATLGNEVIFIVGMPRSGSTLVEQILASHSQVEGAGELGELMQVVREESRRRGAPFPQWVARTTAADWRRMGHRYLELTRRWRTRRARCTDKQPDNWLLLGAARAMLPGARFVDCRRDPLEACWSCYKQMFPEAATFSYDLGDIAAFRRAYDCAAQFWTAAYRGSVRTQSYEALLADAPGQTRQLLEFCDLPFEQECLEFHRTRRHVRTASAAQVREPLRRDLPRAAHYGELLDPLRAALGMPSLGGASVDIGRP